MVRDFPDHDVSVVRVPSPVPTVRAVMSVGGLDTRVLLELLENATTPAPFAEQFPDWPEGSAIARSMVRYLRDHPYPRLDFDSLGGSIQVSYGLDGFMAGVPLAYQEVFSLRFSEALEDFGMSVLLGRFVDAAATPSLLSTVGNAVATLIRDRECVGRGTVAECFSRRIGVHPFTG